MYIKLEGGLHSHIYNVGCVGIIYTTVKGRVFSHFGLGWGIICKETDIVVMNNFVSNTCIILLFSALKMIAKITFLPALSIA